MTVETRRAAGFPGDTRQDPALSVQYPQQKRLWWRNRLTREELMKEAETFMALLHREQEIKEELLALKMHGAQATQEAIDRKLGQHDSLIAEIKRIRFEEMLPILERITQFIASAKAAGLDPSAEEVTPETESSDPPAKVDGDA